MAWQLGVVGVSVGMEEMGAGWMSRSGDVTTVTRWGVWVGPVGPLWWGWSGSGVVE